MYELDRKFLNSDWLEPDPSSKRFIQNKPDIVSPDDPRLSNSREWIAPTVTFEEAIAGVSNERRAFTPFRARNAIESIAVPRTGGIFTGAVNFDSLVTVTSVDFANNDNNVLIGEGALANNTNGNKNTAIGSQSLASNIDGSHNTAIGYHNIFNNTTGKLNTSIGSRALFENISGEYNTAIGSQALFRNTTGSKNTSHGARSLLNNVEGSKNTVIGYEAGQSVVGSGNVLIGYRAGLNVVGDNNLYIANTGTSNPLILGKFDTNELQVNGSLTVINGLEVTGNSEFEFIDVDIIQNVKSISFDDTNTNLIIGKDALAGLTSGVENTALGNFALANNTTGRQNTASGRFALNSNTTGNFNSAFGRGAMSSNTIGSRISAFGFDALANNTEGISNSSFGFESLFSNTTGSNNSSFGSNSLKENTTGRFNSAFGSGSLSKNTVGDNNSAFGLNTLRSNTTGSFNSSLGFNSLGNNLTGRGNSSFGSSSLLSNTEGSFNTAFGRDSLRSNTIGIKNTAVGALAGLNSLGNSNVFLGYRAGANSTGSSNLYISNNDTINPLIFGNFSFRELQVNGSLAVTEGLEVIGLLESENIQANVIQGDRFNTVEIIVDDDPVDVVTPANGGAFVLMYTGVNDEPEPQVDSSAMVYYNVGDNPALRSNDAGDGVTIVNNNNPNSIIPNTIVIGADQGIIRIRSTWGDPIIIRMTFIV